MTLAHPWVLHLLWILPVAGWLLIAQRRRRRKALERFAESGLLARLIPEDHNGKRLLKGILLLCTLGILILALAGPRWGSHYQEVSRRGVDIMVVVDVSKSMEVEDVKPHRLERARREIIDFLKVVTGDRVGLTAFAGAAFVQCPLTLDYAALEMFLTALQPGIIPVPGTDLGAAVETSLSAFDFKTETDKVMLLITDGEDNEGKGLEAARKAAGQGVKIFVFGIGDPSGGPIPAGGNQGGFKKDADGKLVLSKLDEKTLQEIASVTGGGYVRSVAGDLDLDMLYFAGIKQKTEAQVLKSGKIKVYEERFFVFVLIAFLMLLAEAVLDDKRQPAGKRRFGFLILLAVFSLGSLSMPESALAADPSPDELYRQGRYAEAEEGYNRLDMDHPRDIRYRYNRGCAAFQGGKYPEATAAFSSVLRRTEEPAVRFRAAYNLGNTAFNQGDFEAAAGFFRQALIDDPTSDDARYNLELSLRALEKAKEQASESPQSPPQEGCGKKGEGQKQKSGEKGKEGSPQDSSTPDQKEQGSPQEQEQPSDAQQDQGSAGDKRPETKAGENLSGELKPRGEMAEMEERKDTPEDGTAAPDAKKAEALFDNVRENPAEMLRYMIPDRDNRGVASGKDW
ncbi:MAG: VWA domain-containing protein [Deltaproteobacteria bacterium]|nr:VWA domain-containing protein [Deltaproteobacteria bacterium]